MSSLFLDIAVETMRDADVGSIVIEFWWKLMKYASSALIVPEETDKIDLIEDFDMEKTHN